MGRDSTHAPDPVCTIARGRFLVLVHNAHLHWPLAAAVINTIVISRIFDRPSVPRYAVEYLVYHEMLHLKHPVRLRGSRRCVHPRQFQAEEKLFPELERARRFLKQL